MVVVALGVAVAVWQLWQNLVVAVAAEVICQQQWAGARVPIGPVALHRTAHRVSFLHEALAKPAQFYYLK